MKYIHALADIQTDTIGTGTYVWQFAVILAGASIGDNCNINCHTFIENDVQIGNNVTVKSGVFLWDGIRVHDNVFIGPNATFTNDKYPHSKVYPRKFQCTELGQYCSIGANATILGGVTIGQYAIVGAGSVVTKNVPAYALVTGCPAAISGWVDKNGEKLVAVNADEFVNCKNERFSVKENQLIKL
jgi:UDP-2-acetamido-3-amino-2,3-dideoxy-glucuronate N-acetyltransferase